MTRRLLLGFIVAFAAVVSVSVHAIERGVGAGNYALVNGLNIYYETHGVGRPLILLHGGLGSSSMFGAIIPSLSQHHQVIAVDLQGHGRTEDIDRPLRYEDMAEDIASLIKYLKVPKVDLMGYSIGGGVAFQVAFRHPELVNALIVVSTPVTRQGWYPEMLVGQEHMGRDSAAAMVGTPLGKTYMAENPHPENWGSLHEKLRDLLARDYDWSKELAALQIKTLLVYGDADGVRTADCVRAYELLGGGKQDAGWDGAKMSLSRLAILPGVTHYNMPGSELLATITTQFVERESVGQAPKNRLP